MDISKFKGAIFDLDGTLLDSMEVWHNVDLQFFKNRNIPMPSDYQETIKKMHFPTAATYTKERFNLKDSIEDIMAEWTNLCFDAYKNQIELKKGAFKLLQKLDKLNIKIAYATANSHELCKVCLESKGVWDLFSVKSYVEEVGKPKSEPDIYLLTAERMGISPSDCIVFEDLYDGILGAKKGGFISCGVYDKYAENNKQKIIENADYYINSFEDLL